MSISLDTKDATLVYEGADGEELCFNCAVKSVMKHPKYTINTKTTSREFPVCLECERYIE